MQKFNGVLKISIIFYHFKNISKIIYNKNNLLEKRIIFQNLYKNNRLVNFFILKQKFPIINCFVYYNQTSIFTQKSCTHENKYILYSISNYTEYMVGLS